MRYWGIVLAALCCTVPAAAEQGAGVVISVFEEAPVETVEMPAAVVPERSERQRQPSFEDRQFRALASPQLQTFSGDRELNEYVRAVRRIERQRWRARRAEGGPPEIYVAQSVMNKCAADEDCPLAGSEAVVVTGSRITASPSITNNQVTGVDGGDIVKQIGEYLITLQDGRLFAIHYPTMRLTDRVDAYRRDESGKPAGADWYDEILVQDDQIIVTAYSYEDDASEISVFRLDLASGRIERRGVFLISSDDYYDVTNYATRVVGDKLVIHTPYDVEDLVSREKRPSIRRWQPGEDWEAARRRGRSLLDSRDIHRPVYAVEDPVVHTISICPLDRVATAGLECRSTAFVAGQRSEMYVSPEHVYLWSSAAGWYDYSNAECEGEVVRAASRDVAPGALFRVNVNRGDLDVLGVRGMPFDQFSMDEFRGRFRSLVDWRGIACSSYGQPAQVALLDVVRSSFSDTYREPRESLFTAIPSPQTQRVENRIAGDWLVYGGRSGWGQYPPEPDDYEEGELERIELPPLLALPISRPEAVQRLGHGHSVIRIERVGDDMVVNGYRTGDGLSVTYVNLDPDRARLASRALLPGRYESESRSHAFNSFVHDGGAGIMGVPTVTRARAAGGWWWYSEVSDLSYLTFDPAGLLQDAGQLLATPEDAVETAEGYECEVSCIDWYGNSRPFFMDGKIYGLMATELVEAVLVDGVVAERRRVDLTGSMVAR
jgi:hypothetical protein